MSSILDHTADGYTLDPCRTWVPGSNRPSLDNLCRGTDGSARGRPVLPSSVHTPRGRLAPSPKANSLASGSSKSNLFPSKLRPNSIDHSCACLLLGPSTGRCRLSDQSLPKARAAKTFQLCVLDLRSKAFLAKAISQKSPLGFA